MATNFSFIDYCSDIEFTYDNFYFSNWIFAFKILWNTIHNLVLAFYNNKLLNCGWVLNFVIYFLKDY